MTSFGISAPAKKPKPKNHLFSMTSQLNSNLLETTRGLLRRHKISWTSVHKQLKIGPQFLPTLCQFCILLHCQALHTEFSRQNFAKRWTRNCANNLP